LSGINGEIRPGIVHRIDKDTSGLLVIAKSDFAHRILAAQIQKKEVSRIYLAVAEGNIKQDSGSIDAPIGRNPADRKKMAVVAGGRNAVTHYKVLERFGEYTFLELKLETGRTHQIRVHLSHIGHPITGDPMYGRHHQRFNLAGQALHAARLILTHPRTGEQMEFTAPLPGYVEKLLDTLRMKSAKV
jgi:23S rRNA pseudouridine1911/1915/1917 synthase